MNIRQQFEHEMKQLKDDITTWEEVEGGYKKAFQPETLDRNQDNAGYLVLKTGVMIAGQGPLYRLCIGPLNINLVM